MSDFLLPDVGEGLTEAEIVTWHVAVGDVVSVNQPLCDIETAKSIVELPSPFAGTVTALLAEVGATVEVGVPIVTIDDGVASEVPANEPTPAVEMEIDLSNPAASGGGEGESLVGRAKAERGAVRRARRRAGDVPAASTSVAVVPAPAVVTVPDPDEQRRARVRTKPLVRRLARDLGVDLFAVPATGRDGIVTKEDVLAFAGAATPATSNGTSSHVVVPATDGDDVRKPLAGTSSQVAAPETTCDDVRQEAGGTSGTAATRIPVKGVTKAMAQAMSASAFTAPHVTEWITVDCSATVAWVQQVRERREFAGLRVTPTLLVAKACLLAMRRTPEINSSFVTAPDGSAEIVLHAHVNLGLAAATPRGLVVPNVKNAHALDLLGLARAVTDLVDTAKDGRTPPADLSGGTFTITNVGTFGVDGGTPIINPGESAILAVGAVARRPWVDEASGEIVARDVVTLSLSFDHRHVDGEKGSRFLTDVANVLRDPASALLL